MPALPAVTAQPPAAAKLAQPPAAAKQAQPPAAAKQAQPPAAAKQTQPPAAKPATPPAELAASASRSATGAPTANSFNEMDEEFFARESELSHVSAPDTFDDLDSGPKRKVPPKRRWFLFGARETPPAPKKR
jgi:hypothetical protein